nr:hypothetical protein [Acidipropionibacterium jensenii]
MALERREVDRVREVRGKQLVALCFKPRPVGGEVGELLIASRAALVECGVDFGGEVPVFGLADGDVAVGALDQALRNLHGHGPSGTGGLLRCSAGADEVGVGRAARVGGEVQQHPRPAGAAVQQALQMVSMLHVPGCVRVARLQQRLHLIEQRGLHDGCVRAGMQRALVADHPGVVRVRQHTVESVLPQRLRRTLRRRHRQQATRGEVTQQRSHRGLAGGVLLERPDDQRRAFGIDLDRAYLAASLVGAAHVQVADGCASGGAALSDLLCEPLGDFGGQVAAVELSDGRHDAVDEHPRRGLVDGLGGGHEGDPGVDEGFVNLHVIGAVAGEPVELMHDAEGDAGRGDERQHVLQPVTVCRACGLSGVDELAHDPRPQLVGLPRVRLALGRDREAFLSAAALGLLTRRHTEVGDGEQHGRIGGPLGRRGVECRAAHAGPPFWWSRIRLIGAV